MFGSSDASFVGVPLQGLFFMSGSSTVLFVGDGGSVDDTFLLLIE
jgi:hypothetical protein